MLIQRAGPAGVAMQPTTRFEPIEPLPDMIDGARSYRLAYRPRPLERGLASIVETLHRR